MSIYYNGTEVREIDDALFAAWVAAGNPKAQAWMLQPAQPEYDPATHQCTWDGAQWVVSALPPPPVPESVPAHKFFAALDEMGAMLAVQNYIDSSPWRTRVFFNKAPEFRRDSEGVEAGRLELKWTHAQVDALFICADKIKT